MPEAEKDFCPVCSAPLPLRGEWDGHEICRLLSGGVEPAFCVSDAHGVATGLLPKRGGGG